MTDLAPAVAAILGPCLAVSAGETVLVVADPQSRPIGEAMRDGAAALGADAVLALMDERSNHGTEPPAPIAAALAAAAVFLAPTTKSLSHTEARRRATDGGARGATLPGATAEMLARVMGADIALMQRRSRTLAQLLDEATSARVTCPLGSEITFDLTGRRGLADDGALTQPGAFGNLPAGEGFIAPLAGEGTVVVSSLAGLGISEEPVQLAISGGRLREAHGGAGPEFLAGLRAYGELGMNLAELGVGTNEAATLTGNVLEDEKILGSIHVAFGASSGIGGAVSVGVHLDVVVADASLEVDGQRVLESGRYLLDAGGS